MMIKNKKISSVSWLAAALITSSASTAFAAVSVAVTASVTASGHIPENAIDNNLTTRWNVNGEGHWIQFDLGEVYIVEALDIAFFKGDERTATFEIQTSINGNDWQSQFNGEQPLSTESLQIIDINDVEAQFVRIIGYGNTANNWTTISEVNITGSDLPVEISNIALNKATEQSSTGYNGVASRAVDGNLNGKYNGNSVTHTAQETQPWWQVDLGSVSEVSYIDLYNRTDSCCTSRLSNFYVLLSDAPFASTDLDNTLSQPGVESHYFASADSKTTIDVDSDARYVRVQLEGSNALSLAEVEVYGVEGSGDPVNTEIVPDYCESLPPLEFDSPYAPTTPEKIANAFPKFSWDRVPRTMLIRHSTAGYSDAEIERMAELYDLIVLEKANGGFDGYHSIANRLKAVNPDVKVLFYWNSRIYFGHNDVDDYIEERWDDFIDPDFIIRDTLNTYQRENPDFIDWWVGVASKIMGLEAGYSVTGSPFQPSPIDGVFIDKTGYPTYMAQPLWEATPDHKLVMNNNKVDRDRIAYVDGTYQEGWHGGWTLEDTSYGIELAQESGVNKKFTMLRNPMLGRPDARAMEDSLMTPLAAYLIYADEYSYFYYQKSVDARLKPDWEWLTDYVDQGNRPLGVPYCHAKRDGYTYSRSFKHADVYFDLTPEELEYPLPSDKNVSGPGVVNSRIMWKNDIGSPALIGGGYSDTDNTYTLKGGGNISGTSDNFFYLSDLHYGDGEFKARIELLNNTHAQAKAGLMFRERNEPGSTRKEVIEAYENGTVFEADARMVAVVRTIDGNMQMIHRSTKGGSIATTGTGAGAYAKLVRSGDTFTGFTSDDGSNWTEIGSVTIALPEKVELGMAVASHSATERVEATFAEFERYETSAFIMP
jgi:hypothetical protein